mgnify:CR=1 FL=1
MFDSFLPQIQELLQAYGAMGVFAGSIIEEVIAPIPSTMVILFGGFFLVPQDATFWEAAGTVVLKVMIPASIGMSLGSLFPYYIARLGERVAVKKFGKLLQVDDAMIDKAQAYFAKSKSDEMLLFVVRAVPVVPSVVIGVFCGLMKLPVKEFLIWSFLGSLIRTFILGMVGWATGAAYTAYAHRISQVEDVVLYACIAGFVGLVVWYYFFRRRKKASKQN